MVTLLKEQNQLKVLYFNVLVKTKIMEIRFAKKDDIEQIVKLCELHANYEKAAFDATNKESSLLKHLFDSLPSVKCIVVEHANQLVGYATFMKQLSTWDAAYYIHLDCLFFKEEVRGNGLGTKLMEKVKVYAKSENCEVIQWHTPDFNIQAIKFYQKLGTESKTKERFYWNI